jgi:hypothetical protein
LQAATTTTTAPALSASSPALKAGGGGMHPDSLTDGQMFLTVAPTGTGQLLISVLNAPTPTVNYFELWWTPALANPALAWQMIAVTNGTYTNFTVSTTVYPTGFYRVSSDTNAVPLWEAADPNNQATGILNVWIDTPANGTTLN